MNAKENLYFVCNLGYMMRAKGIKHLPELSFLTKIPQIKLRSFMNNDFEIDDFELLNQLATFFKCRKSNLVEKKKTPITTWHSITPDFEMIQGFVYFIRAENTGYVKIGRTGDLIIRLQTLERDYNTKIEVIHYISTYDTVTLEKTMHKLFADKRVEGEWFNLSDNDIARIKAE